MWLYADYLGKPCVATTNSLKVDCCQWRPTMYWKAFEWFFVTLRWLHDCQNVFRCTNTPSSSSHWINSISTSSLHALNKTKTLLMMSNCLWQRQGHYSNWKISSTRIIPTKTTTTYQIGGELSNESCRHVQKFVLGGISCRRRHGSFNVDTGDEFPRNKWQKSLPRH